MVRLEPEQSYNESLLPLQVCAASAGAGLHPPVADGRVSGRLPDAVPALEVFRERALHEAVLYVSQLQPRVADWRGSGRLPAAMRGQPHPLSLRQAVLPVCPGGLDRRNPQQRRHPALKSGSPATIDFSVRSIPRPPRCPVCVHNITSLSYLRARRIDGDDGVDQASGLMLG